MSKEEVFGKALIKHHLISNHIEKAFKTTPKNQHHILHAIQQKANEDIDDLNNAHGGGFLDWLKSLLGMEKKGPKVYSGESGWNQFKADTAKNSKEANNMLATLGFHRRPY